VSDPVDGSAAAAPVAARDRAPEADLARVTTIPIASRPNKVSAEQFATPSPGDGPSFERFISSLPRVLQAETLLRLVDAIVRAVERERAIVWMLGGHVVKTGIAPLLIDLMDRGAATHLPPTAPRPSTTTRWRAGAAPARTWRPASPTGPSAWRTRPGAT
jgi:hypothetical protein